MSESAAGLCFVCHTRTSQGPDIDFLIRSMEKILMLYVHGFLLDNYRTFVRNVHERDE